MTHVWHPPSTGLMPCEQSGEQICEITPLVPSVSTYALASETDAQVAMERLLSAESRIRELHLNGLLTVDEKWKALDEVFRLERLVLIWHQGFRQESEGKPRGWPWFGRVMN